MLEVLSQREEHLEDTALLVSNRYQRLLRDIPQLPHSYVEVARDHVQRRIACSKVSGGPALTLQSRFGYQIRISRL